MAKLQLEDYLPTLDERPEPEARPFFLRVEHIDEDPAQPRHEFDDNALLELAATIKERGVLQPISVRPHPQAPGRWLLNFGARRLRASRLAGLKEIPALIDTTGDSYDQMIENEQRVGLTPLELALFVQKRLAAGEKRAEIARRLGKSRQYLTLATALIEAPDWLLDAYRQGRCRGLAELYELRRLQGDHPRQVQAWAAATGSITRDRVAILKNELNGQDGRIDEIPTSTGETAPGEEDAETAERSIRPAATTVGPRRHLNRRVHVEFEGQDYQLVLSVAPPREGTMYVRPLSGGPRRAAPASALKLRGFVDR